MCSEKRSTAGPSATARKIAIASSISVLRIWTSRNSSPQNAAIVKKIRASWRVVRASQTDIAREPKATAGRLS